MSLKLSPAQSIPATTQATAKAAFPKGNPCMTLRDHLGTVFSDEQFSDLFPKDGQPALAPWKLALVTVLQFGENLSEGWPSVGTLDRKKPYKPLFYIK